MGEAPPSAGLAQPTPGQPPPRVPVDRTHPGCPWTQVNPNAREPRSKGAPSSAGRSPPHKPALTMHAPAQPRQAGAPPHLTPCSTERSELAHTCRRVVAGRYMAMADRKGSNA
ncbi:hypothetical protein GCM10009601_15400 [Streptomyces thermospinosisporus]|uniref:Uncharacterized protein n=1 Tax=Streptomyces thermospinosisporus TaxID=161482 RepID=A0ABP4JGA4_9ACTN